MKSAFITVAFCLALVYCQTIPPSTNPNGEDYFSPNNVKTLTLNQTINGTIWNITDYTEFYALWIPLNVDIVRYIMTNTGCNDYVYAYINFIHPKLNNAISYPCINANGTYNPLCLNYQYYLNAFPETFNWAYFRAGANWKPGKWQLISVTKTNYTEKPCNYSVRAESFYGCSENSILSLTAGIDNCTANSEITNVTSNGQTISSVVSSIPQYDSYRIDVPQNVSRVWAWVTSTSPFGCYIAAGYLAYDYYYSIDNATGQDNGNGVYTGYVQYQLPDGDYPLFISVLLTSPGSYNISFHWSACSPNTAGLGNMGVTYSNASSYFIIPDCSDPVVNSNIDVTSPNQDLVFNVPAYNSTADYGYSAQYGFINVSAGTVGSVLFTCNSTTSSTFIAFSKGAFPSCSTYNYNISCSTQTGNSDDYLYLLSNDLYPGGYWSVAVCSSQTAVPNSVVTLNVARTAAPSPSPSPGSVPSASSSPGSGEDSSMSDAVLPTLILIVLAVAINF